MNVLLQSVLLMRLRDPVPLNRYIELREHPFALSHALSRKGVYLLLLRPHFSYPFSLLLPPCTASWHIKISLLLLQLFSPPLPPCLSGILVHGLLFSPSLRGSCNVACLSGIMVHGLPRAVAASACFNPFHTPRAVSRLARPWQSFAKFRAKS